MSEQGLTPLLTAELNSAIDERDMAALLEEHLPPFLLHSKPVLALKARRKELLSE